MHATKKMSGIAIAVASAAAFMVAPISIASASSKVQCTGVNACKGKSSCKSASNACKGQNACKGKGFVGMTKAQCDQVGGTAAAAPAAAAPAAK